MGNQNKKMSFDMGVTFPLSQDSELGDKDLNDLVEEIIQSKEHEEIHNTF